MHLCSLNSSNAPLHWTRSQNVLANSMKIVKRVGVELEIVKVAHTRLPSVGFRSWSWFLAVSLQVTWVINPAVGCHYFSPGLQLPPQPLRELLPILLLGEQRHIGKLFTPIVTMGVNSLPNTVTWQRRDCDLNTGPSAPKSSTLSTRLPSHPLEKVTLAKLSK